MATRTARTQWPQHAQQDGFDICQLDVDLQEGICEITLMNVTAGLGYAEILHLINQLEVVRDLLEPKTPAGKTYAPKLGEH